MIIVFVVDMYDVATNGTTMSARRFARQLRDNGHVVRIVATGKTEKDKYVVPRWRIPIVEYFASKQGFIFARPDEEALARAFQGADIVHLFLPLPLECRARKIAQKMGIPCSAAFHLQPENISYNIHLKAEWLSQLLYFFMKRYFYDHFDQIHCPSSFIAGQLQKHGYKAKLHVISNGITDEFHPVELPHSTDQFHILLIGRLSPEKRQDILIDAVAKSKHADKIQLHFAGSGPDEAALRRQGSSLPNPPTFGFYEKKELLELIHTCDLYVHASDVDIEGIACLEAIACGLVPVISDSPKSATSQFALTEMSLFRAGDSDSLARRIDYWLENPVKRKAMSRRYAKQADNFKIDKSVQQIETMFKETIRESKVKKMPEPGLPARILQWLLYYVIAAPILAVINFLFFGLRVEGAENLKGLKGAVVLCNHVHYLDSAMVACSVFPRRVYFTSLKDNFDIPVIGWLLRQFRCISVGQTLEERKLFLREAARILRAGNLMAVYPEGELQLYSKTIRPFKRGAFWLAAETQTPVVPIVIRQRPATGLWKLFRKKSLLTLKIGTPISSLTDLSVNENSRRLQENAHQAMTKIAQTG